MILKDASIYTRDIHAMPKNLVVFRYLFILEEKLHKNKNDHHSTNSLSYRDCGKWKNL